MIIYFMEMRNTLKLQVLIWLLYSLSDLTIKKWIFTMMQGIAWTNNVLTEVTYHQPPNKLQVGKT